LRRGVYLSDTKKAECGCEEKTGKMKTIKQFSLCLCVGLFFLLTFIPIASSEVYKEEWLKFSKNQKFDYVRGLCDGTLFGLRSAYGLKMDEFNAKYAQIVPLGTTIKDIIKSVDLFYKEAGTDMTSVSWVLYIRAQEGHQMSPDKLLALRETAEIDYNAFQSE
jgi:hypothetical protein